VCLFRDKTNLTLQKSIIWGVTNIGSIVRDIYGEVMYRDITYGEESY
jgi:hypothetical protein